MSRIKMLSAAALAFAMLLLVFPAGAADTPVPERVTHSGVLLDTDPAGGYTGDYVIIYNPTADTATGMSTGSLSGLIETSVDPGKAVKGTSQDSIRAGRIDVDAEFRAIGEPDGAPASLPERTNWGVGDTKSFNIRYYNPSGTGGNMTFKVLYVGAHCRVWTPLNSSYYPVDSIDPSYAAEAGAEFDSKFDLMQSSFGDFRDSNGDGKVNILFYNIEDGWEPGYGYIAGYFWSGDYQINSLPMIHIDTYPGVIAPDQYGELVSDITDCYPTLVHEFQHLINYSECGSMHDWLDESFAGAAEEMCYPGSSLFSRIQSWQGYYYQSVSELCDPPREVAYNPGFKLHRGGSLADWNNNDLNDDLLARYAGVMFFSQYLYTKYGSTSIYRRVIESCSGGSVQASINALTQATGWPIETIWRDYAISMIANDRDSGYGFNVNPGYDPDEFYGVEDIYELLPAIIYTSTSAASVQGGGFITVKPVNGVFIPPSDAAPGLRYVGVSFPDYLPGDVNFDGLVNTEDALMTLRCALGLTSFTDDQIRRGDLDMSGYIDTTDALLILRKALGIH